MNNEEYRDEGFRLYNEDREKALECFMKAAEGKDIPSGVAIAVYYYEDCEDDDANKHAKDWIEKVFEWYEILDMPVPIAPLAICCMPVIGRPTATPT